MAQARGELILNVPLDELRDRLTDPAVWARDQWEQEVAAVEHVDDRAVRVVLASGMASLMTQSRIEADVVEYVFPPAGAISLRRSVSYALRPTADGTHVSVTEAVDATLGFKIASFGLYVPLVAFIARRNLRHELTRLAGADLPSTCRP